MRTFLFYVSMPVWGPLLVLGCCLIIAGAFVMDFIFGDADGYERALEDA